jgi:hypothetical protein
MSTDPGQSPRRRLRPIHVVVALVLLVALGLYAVIGSNVARTLVGHGPPGQPNDPGTTRQEAEANSRGQGPQGANSSQDSYTTQNRSRTPPDDGR